MLTPHQQKSIAEELNKIIDIPVIPEKGEYYLFLFAVKKIDQLLDEYMPENWKNFFDVGVGFEWSDQESQESRVELFKMMDDKVQLPFIGRERKREILSKAANILTNGLKKGGKL